MLHIRKLMPDTIRCNLLLIVVCGALPLLLVILLSGWDRREEQVRDARHMVSSLSESIASQQEQTTRGIHEMLKALSLFPEMQGMDAAACTELFRHLNEVTPFYVNIALFDGAGNAVASALPFRQANIADRKDFSDAVRTRAFSVGEYATGRLSRLPILPFTHPVLDGQGQLIGVVLISLDLQKMTSLYEAVKLPPDSFISFADHRGVRLFHYPESEAFPPGDMVSGAIRDITAPIEKEGLLTKKGGDGVRRILAVRRLSLAPDQAPYLNIFIGIPESTVLARADAVTRRYLVWLAASLLVSGALAWLIGRYGLYRRMDRLVAVTQRLGSGDLSARSGLPRSRGMLGVLAGSIDEMSAALERDTTELRRVKEALEAEIVRRRDLMDISSDGIAIIDQDHRIIECNRRFAEMLGYAPEEMAELRTWDYEASMTEEDIRRDFSDFNNLRQTFETVHRRKDGQPINVEVSGCGATMDGESFILAIVRDITERKRMADALLREQQFTSALIASLPGIFYLYSYPELRLEHWNTNHERLLGFGPGEIAGRSILDWHLPGSLEAVRQAVETVMREGSGMVESSLLTKTGQAIPFLLTGVRFDALGKTYLMGVGLDITERKHMETALVEMKDRAEAASRAKSEFLATMSHEIRTPLNGVLGMLQLAQATGLTPEQQGYADVAMQSGRSLLQVLSDILDISKIEVGALRIEAEDFRPAELFDPILRAFAETSRSKGLDFAFALDPALPETLRGDAGRVRQVIYNLVGNSLKYTEQGEVRLEAFTLRTGGSGVRLVLAVSDTGIGVPGDKLQAIFDAFTQADGSYTRRYGGAGLGLAIVRRLVQLMGGDIGFCSRPGQGTEVLVSLPLEAGAAAPGPAPQPAAPESTAVASGLDVLLAEDDPVNRLTVSHMLVKTGHRVHTVENGAQAVAFLAGHPVDCVLMDIQMPEMDGVEATRRIRGGLAGPAARAVPIVALTAHAMKGDRTVFLAAGMDDYIAKPVDMGELARVLASLAGRARAAG